MTSGTNSVFDMGALSALKTDVRRESAGSLEAVAEQFESLFARMMLKSMRAASFGDPIFGGDQNEFYRDMFDDQMAVELAKGRGLGIADMLVRQLGGAEAQPSQGAMLGPIRRTGSAEGQPVKSPEDFMSEIWPHAERVGKKLGVEPEAIVAQAALETGWGNRGINTGDGRQSHNLFGVKAGSAWRGQTASVATLEYGAGGMRRQREDFRVYDTLQAGLDDYANLLGQSGRYQQALEQGPDAVGFVRALADAGYATDPDYAGKLEAIMTSQRFRDSVARLRDGGEGHGGAEI